MDVCVTRTGSQTQQPPACLSWHYEHLVTRSHTLPTPARQSCVNCIFPRVRISFHSTHCSTASSHGTKPLLGDNKMQRARKHHSAMKNTTTLPQNGNTNCVKRGHYSSHTNTPRKPALDQGVISASVHGSMAHAKGASTTVGPCGKNVSFPRCRQILPRVWLSQWAKLVGRHPLLGPPPPLLLCLRRGPAELALSPVRLQKW